MPANRIEEQKGALQIASAATATLARDGNTTSLLYCSSFRAALAQLVERRVEGAGVVGSNPSGGTIHHGIVGVPAGDCRRQW